ncbi:MAG: hypothetical protein ACRCU5_07910, partial [Rhizobiaceae bacterium]
EQINDQNDQYKNDDVGNDGIHCIADYALQPLLHRALTLLTCFFVVKSSPIAQSGQDIPDNSRK